VSRGPKRKVETEPCQIHDHFDGSAHCVQCGGECQLRGGERIATELIRWMCEAAALRGESKLRMCEEHVVRKSGADLTLLMTRAWETTKRWRR